MVVSHLQDSTDHDGYNSSVLHKSFSLFDYSWITELLTYLREVVKNRLYTDLLNTQYRIASTRYSILGKLPLEELNR